MAHFIIREIQLKDNPDIEMIIKSVMTAYNCVGKGFSIEDAEVKDMYHHYQKSKSIYYVIENSDNHQIYGGGGIAALIGYEDQVCELKKMYFLPEIRAKGLGSTLLNKCIESAQGYGYKTIYLETVTQMVKANKLYSKFNFEQLEAPLGRTGHCGCNLYYKKEL